MPELKGSRTEANLLSAFAGESQARNKYDYLASKAKKDGYEQIAAFFEEPPPTKKSTQKCGLNSCTVSERPRKISSLLPRREL
jgi:rubrerythrin